jgi:hypothetical protein
VTAIVIGNAVLALSVVATVVTMISWAILADRRAIEARSVHQADARRTETNHSVLSRLETAVDARAT